MLHGAKGSYYMVPTKEFIEYTWDIVKRAIVMFRPVTIAFEEPEMWNQSGYSDGFKAEWKEYFKEDWQDPQSSPEAMLKSMELKTWLFERIIGVMYERIEKLAPGTKMYIATHSTVNYNAWGITAGLNHYMATGKITLANGTYEFDKSGKLPLQQKLRFLHLKLGFLAKNRYICVCAFLPKIKRKRQKTKDCYRKIL